MINYKWLKYCPEHYEEIENYELAKADNFIGWCCHHRNGEEFSREWLKLNNMYFNRSDPREFKFMHSKDHARLHFKLNGTRKGKHLSEETKAKMSEKMRGRKRKPFSAETRKKMSISQSRRRSNERIS